MRQIGTLPDRTQASRLASYLITQGISCEAEKEGNGGWSLWVHDENQIDSAKQSFQSFRDNPEAPEFQGHEARAEEIVKQDQDRRTESQQNMVDMRQNWAQPTGAKTPFVTSLIVLTVVVALLTGLGRPLHPGTFSYGMRNDLKFVEPRDYAESEGDALHNIKRGHVWRIVTPIFLHGDALHLGFNMIMLFQFGRLLERKLGAPKLALLVLTVAVTSNCAQALTPEAFRGVLGGANFGGMSGVVYGLFGYAWVRSQIDPSAGFFISPSLVFLMLGWLVLCLTSVITGVANMAHIAGLMCGMVAAQVR